MKKGTKTMQIAFCGMMAAFSVTLMFLSGIVSIASFAFPALAGCVLVPVVVEAGLKWAYAVYCITAVLSFFLTADKEAMLIYVLFFGYYPALFATIGKISSALLRWTVKFLVINAAAVVDVLLTYFVFKLPMEEIISQNAVFIVLIWIALNLAFLLYDKALDGIVLMYYSRFHKTVQKIFRF
jgi:hypothetical protein